MPYAGLQTSEDGLLALRVLSNFRQGLQVEAMLQVE